MGVYKNINNNQKWLLCEIYFARIVLYIDRDNLLHKLKTW